MATTYKLIASTTLGSDTASVTFGSGGTIPQTFDDLVVVVSARASTSGYPAMLLRFNADSGSNYSYRILEGSGASASSSSSASATSVIAANLGGSGTTADTFGNVEIYIPNYASGDNKSVSTTSVLENNATTAYINAIAGLWSDTTAIDEIELFPSSNNFVTGSSFFLYGIKKA